MAVEPSHRTLPSWALFGLVMVGACVTVLVHNRFLFSQPIGAEGDFGLNGLLADQARHFTLWQGNYSRVGFHHPGPALLYVMMAGDVVAHSWLHLVPAATNGMIVGQVVFDAALLGAVALVVRRLTGSVLAGVFLAALVLLPVAHVGGAADPWPPFQYMPAYGLFVVAGIAVASGVTRAATAYVVGAGLLAHGQVSFLLFVAVTTVVVVLGWWRVHRGGVRSAIRDDRRRLTVTAVVLGIFLLPLVLQTVFHRGGPWYSYAAYTFGGGGSQPNALLPAISWLRWYVPNSGVPFALAGAAAVVGVVLAVTERDPGRRRTTIAVLVMAVVQALLLVLFAWRGVDGLTEANRYLAYFALVLTPVVGGLVTVLLGLRLQAVLPRVSGPRVAALGTGAVAAALVVALLVWLVPDRRVESTYRGVPATIALARDLDQDASRAGRPIALRLQPAQPIGTFAYTAGVVFELRQRGVDACVWSTDAKQQKRWTIQFTAPYTCDPADLGRYWQLSVTPGSPGAGPAGVVYHDTQVTVAPL